MAWIKIVPPTKAHGDLEEVYRAIDSARGGIADIHQVQSLNPHALRAHLELYKAVVFQKSSLSRVMRERIGVAVSATNCCHYCVAHHSAALRTLQDDPVVIDALGRGEVPDFLPQADAGMLRWARQAASDPVSCSEASIQELRLRGFDDRAILDAALTASYVSFVNRLALLLGLDVEAGFEKTCRNATDEF